MPSQADARTGARAATTAPARGTGGGRRARRRLRNAATWTFRATAGVCVAGLLLRGTIRDEWHPLAFVFYATPPALVTLASVAGLAAAAFLRLRLLTAVFAATFAGGLASIGEQHRGEPVPRDAPPPGIRGMLWNVEHGSGGWPEILAEIRAFDPGVVWMIEGPGAGTGESRMWRTGLPGMTHAECGGHLHVFAHGEAELVATRRLGVRGARAALVRVRTGGVAFETVICDVPSRPFADRLPILEAAREWAASRPGPVLVVGDFNTPPDSAGFDAWRPAFRHAWEEAGGGWGPTWPVPLPVLHLDHVWAGPGVRIASYATGDTGVSDHRPVVVEFGIGEAETGGR